NELAKDAGRPRVGFAGPAIEELDAVVVGPEQGVSVGVIAARHLPPMRLPPGPVKALGDLPLLWPDEANVNVPPADGTRKRSALPAGQVRLVEQVHAAEIRDLVVDDEQLAVVAAVKDLKDSHPPQRFPEGMKGMDLDPGLLHLAEE